MIKLEIFNKKEKKKELYEREDTSVIELEEYWKLQEKLENTSILLMIQRKRQFWKCN